MIQSFADKRTERLWNRERVRSIDSRICRFGVVGTGNLRSWYRVSG